MPSEKLLSSYTQKSKLEELISRNSSERTVKCFKYLLFQQDSINTQNEPKFLRTKGYRQMYNLPTAKLSLYMGYQRTKKMVTF